MKPTPATHPWFVRKWYKGATRYGYMAGERDVNTSYTTEAEARAAYDALREPGQTESVLLQYVNIGTPAQRYVQIARKKTPKV